MNFLTYKLASFLLLASSLVTSSYCMEIKVRQELSTATIEQINTFMEIKVRRELSTATTEQINTFAETLDSTIKQRLELPNILLRGPLNSNKATVAKNLAQRCGLTCLCVSVADLCKSNPHTAAKKLEELFKSAKTSTKKVMLILENAGAFKESSSITNQFLALTDTRSSEYMLVFTVNDYNPFSKELSSKVDTSIYIDTVLVVVEDSTDLEVNSDDTVEPKGECSLQ